MLRYARGDMAAFEMLYARHKGPMFRYLVSLCRDQAIAEELFQEVWVKLINARSRFSDSMPFSGYFYKLAHNHFIDHYRKQQVRVVAGQSLQVNDVAEPATEASPEQELEMQQAQGTFERTLNSLPREQLEVFLLKQETGMSLQQIASVTGVDIETAKSRMRYAITKLQSVLRK